jgi:putative hydrolase of the HAD superfamily
MNIDAVGFDLDGTLYPRSMMYRLSFPLALRYPRFLYHFSRVRRALRKLACIDGFRETQASLVAARLGLDQATAERLVERIVYREWVAMLRGIRPFPHVRAALERLRAAGLRLGLMSDSPVEEKLAFLGLEGLWDASFCSEETGYLKPHPSPFGRLAAELGADPRRVLYVGDSESYDVAGAAAAGMRTALIGGRRRGADLTFSSYRVLAELVERRFG